MKGNRSVVGFVRNQEFSENESLEPLDSSRQTLHAQVTQRLRDAITSGRLAPGERLQADALANELGVSRMPVREALHILQAEGLVEFYPYRGARVSKLSRDEILQVFVIRIILEPAAVRLAVENMMDQDLLRLRELFRKLGESESDVDTWIALDREFFFFLYELSEQPRLWDLIAQQRASIERYVRAYISVPLNIPNARVKHRQIVEACERRDAHQAMIYTQHHLEEVRDIFLNQLQLQGEEVVEN